MASNGGPPGPPPVVRDERFKALHSDPRFARKPKTDHKVKVDERFAAVLKDPRFNDQSGSKRKRARGEVDARGKGAKVARKDGTLAERLYELEEKAGSEEEGDGGNHVFAEGGDDGDEDAGSARGSRPGKGTLEDRLERLNRLARGELSDDSEFSSSEEEKEETEDARAERLVDELNEDVEVVIDPEAPDLHTLEYIPDGSESRRLALVNLDWDHLQAVDILVVLQSFLPTAGAITDVTIYPSDYGLKKMAEEARFGPTPLLNKPGTHVAGTSGSSTGGSSSKAGGGGVGSGKRSGSGKYGKAEEEGEGGRKEEFDPTILRAYELNKMKYFYAVVTCDSVDTAIHIYTQCDGLEFEASSNVFDLRFVPDETEFTNAPHDTASSVPEDYEPPTFATAALQSSKVDLTWDAEDPQRKRSLNWEKLKSVSADIDDEREDQMQNLKDYLASSDSDSESEDEEMDEGPGGSVGGSKAGRRQAKRAQYKALLKRGRNVPTPAGGDDDDAAGGDGEVDVDGLDSGGDDDESESESEEEEGGLEITFTPGLGKDILKKRKEKEAVAHESVWEAYQRKRKDKKKEKRAARKAAREAGGSRTGKGKNSATAAAAAAGGSGSEDDSSGDDDGMIGGAGASGSFFVGADGLAADMEGSGSESNEGAALPASKGKGKGKSGKKAGDAESRLEAAQLALLMAGEEDSEGEGGRNYDAKALLRQQKVLDKATRKAAKSKSRTALTTTASTSTGEEGEFAVDSTDSRFASVMHNPEFSIDPTAPQFRNTAGMRDILVKKSAAASAAAASGPVVDKRPMVVASKGASGGVGVSVAASNEAHTGDVKLLAQSVKAKFGGAAKDGSVRVRDGAKLGGAKAAPTAPAPVKAVASSKVKAQAAKPSSTTTSSVGGPAVQAAPKAKVAGGSTTPTTSSSTASRKVETSTVGGVTVAGAGALAAALRKSSSKK